MEKKYCKYCGTTENLIIRNNNKILSVCKIHYLQFNKERYLKEKKHRKEKYIKNKKCKYCGTIENLYVYNKKFIANCCVKHYKQYLENKNKKRNKTNLKKYGVENPLQLETVQNKIKQTNLKRYGAEWTSQNKDVKEKRNKTNLKRYGVENISQSEIIKNKIKQTNLKRYGVENISQLKTIKENRNKTNLERYGVENSFNIKTKENKNNYWQIFVLKLKQKQIEPLFDKEYYINNKLNFNYKCLRCNKNFESDNYIIQKINCGCGKWRSYYEDEIIDWILSNKSNIIVEKNKKFNLNNINRELDIYLPEYNFGIDFHGLYWHNDIIIDKNYHQQKWKIFKENNIQLIQIFESEWINKQDIVKSIILSKLNIYQNKIYARNTIIKEINNEQYKLFLEQNHIQGTINSKIRIGLFYNNELVSVIGVSNSRFKKNEYEIIRFCNKLNTQIIGGFSKLLNYVNKNYKFENLVSFIDLRYFDGSGYIKNGFKINSITQPNYFYFIKNYFDKNNFNLYSRIQFQKHKLKDKLEKFNSESTEYQNMLNNNYLRIFDAGNYKLIYN